MRAFCGKSILLRLLAPRQTKGPPPTALIKGLALWDIRNELDHSSPSIRHALHLATTASASSTSTAPTNPHPISTVFPHHKSLCPHAGSVRLACRPQHRLHQACRPLIVVLNTVPTIQRLAIANRLPFFSLHPHALPHGPDTSILDIATYRNRNPTSTNFEGLAFPHSPILRISHNLTRPALT